MISSLLRYGGLAALLSLLPLAAPAARAQEESPSEPPYARVLASDSLAAWSLGVSPDGRWVVFSSSEGPDESSLWIAPTGGGPPTRLTSPGYWDTHPSWSPGGDRVIFSSNRPAREESKLYGMTLPVDRKTGRPVGVPRQLTLDEVATAVRPSPDGEWIAYEQRHGPAFHLRIAPAMGGTARTLVESDYPMTQLTWSSDGRSIQYFFRPRGTEERVVTRVPVAGGPPTELFRTTRPVRAISPSGLVAVSDAPGMRQQGMTLLDPSGREVARLPLGARMRPAAFSLDGETLYLLENQTTAPIRLVPVAGGPFRAITAGKEYDWPVGWLSGGSTVAVETRVDGREALLLAPTASGAGRVLPLPRSRGLSSLQFTAGRTVAYTVNDPGTGRHRLIALDPDTREQRVLSEDMPRGVGVEVTGPGGEWRDGDRFLYLHREGDEVQIRTSSLAGPDRILRTFPATLLGNTTFAVHGKRVAWWQARGDSTYLMVSEGATAEPRAIFSVPVRRSAWTSEIAFSWDGRRIAAHEPAEQGGATTPILVVDVPPPGQRGAARRIETGALYWYYPRWLPDDSGIVSVAGYGSGAESHILMTPVRSGEAPVVLTRDDPSPKWGFILSPDGKTVAYPGEVAGGSAIWRLDLDQAVPVTGRARR